MDSSKKELSPYEDMKVPVKLKLSLLWATVLFCYLYGDYFGLYKPGKLKGMLDGTLQHLGPTSQGILLGLSISMAIPSLMVFLSLVLSPKVSRSVNIVVGVIYTLFVLITMPGSWNFYLFFGTVDMILTSLIIWYAWTWPRMITSKL
jgi:hypothetical protein